MLKDSKGLFDVITNNSMTSERRLMIDLLADLQAYSRMEISDNGLVRTHYNPADTKVLRCDALESVLELGKVGPRGTVGDPHNTRKLRKADQQRLLARGTGEKNSGRRRQ